MPYDPNTGAYYSDPAAEAALRKPGPVRRANPNTPLSANLQERFEGQFGKNPFDPNSENPEERKAASEWNKKRTEDLLSGRPQAPDFESAMGEDYSLKPGFSLADKFKTIGTGGIGGIQLGTSGVSEIEKRALAQGPSAWASLAEQKQRQDEMSRLGDVASSGRGQLSGALSSLAMKGGLGSGARERLATQAMRGTTRGQQDVRQAGAGERLNIGMQDESNKLGLLQMLPGAQTQQFQAKLGQQESLFDRAQKEREAKLGAEKFDIQAKLNEMFQKRAYDTGQFGEAMRAWAAGETADAQASAGKK